MSQNGIDYHTSARTQHISHIVDTKCTYCTHQGAFVFGKFRDYKKLPSSMDSKLQAFRESLVKQACKFPDMSFFFQILVFLPHRFPFELRPLILCNCWIPPCHRRSATAGRRTLLWATQCSEQITTTFARMTTEDSRKILLPQFLSLLHLMCFALLLVRFLNVEEGKESGGEDDKQQ